MLQDKNLPQRRLCFFRQGLQKGIGRRSHNMEELREGVDTGLYKEDLINQREACTKLRPKSLKRI